MFKGLREQRMKWLRTMVVIAVCGLLMGVVASTPDAAKSGKNGILEEYQRIQESNSSIRTFSYEDGAPQIIYSTLRDNYGYLWTQNYDTGNHIHRFNGTSFTDIQKEEPLIKNDSLVANIIQTNDKTIHLATRHYLLRWIGYRFIRYAFPKDDRIIEAQAVDNRIMCIGVKGYAVLDGNKWTYLRTPVLGAISADRSRSYFGSISPYTGSISSLDGAGNLINLQVEEFKALKKLKRSIFSVEIIAYPWKKDLMLQYYSKQGRYDIQVLKMEQIKNLADQDIIIDMKLVNLPSGATHLCFLGTNMIFRFDSERRKLFAKHLQEGSKIRAIAKDKQHNIWICYEQDKHLYLQELGDAVNPVGMKYYLPEGAYDPITNYHILLDDETHMVSNRIYFNTSSALFRLNRGYPELSKCEFPEINITGDYAYGVYPDLKIFNHYVCLGVPRKDMPGVHRIYLYDMLNGQKEYLDVSDPASNITCLDYNHESRIIMVKGRDRLLALPFRKTISQIKTFEGKYGYSSIIESSNKIAILYRIYDSQADKARAELYSQNKGQLAKLFTIDNGYMSQQWKADRAYIRDNGNFAIIREVDLMNGNEKAISAKKTNYKLIPDTEGCYLLYDDLSIEKHSPSGLKSYYASAITAAIEPTAKQAGLDFEAIWDNLYPWFIGEERIFFNCVDAEIRVDADGNKVLDSARFSNHAEKLPPQKLEYIPGSIPKLRIPSFTYNLKDGKLTWHPNWISATPLPRHEGDVFLVKYWEGDKDKGRIRFSKFEKGKLIPSDLDFTYAYESGSYPWIEKFHDKNGLYYEADDKLFYLQGNTWKPIPLDDYRLYGTLQRVGRFGEDLWLTFDSALIRYSLKSEQSFVFGSKDGIPSDLSALYQEQGKFYLLSNSGVYHFAPEEVGATLMIPWLQANGSRFSSSLIHRFKHTQNNLIFPVDILNTLFPERMKLSYYLKGYDKDWKHRDYASQIEYPQLPPGKYEFQIYGTSPTGRQSSTLTIPFRIKPPIYANIWAYLIYLLALYWIGRHLYRLRIKQLQQRNLAMEKVVSDRTQELRDRQQRLDESIDYASLIQKSILPQPADMAAAFKEHFVIWKPRDVLGGDFYWLHETEEGSTFLAVIDCTGHGVPAALLTMTVNSLLNNLIRDKRQEQLGQILETMHEEIGKALHQEQQHTQQDGFEISLIKWNKVQQSLCFAGAGLNLLYRRPEDTELQQLRGEKHGIGGLKWHKERIYTEQTINDAQALCIYLYTDGILDQLDDKDGKLVRFGHQGWISLLDSLTSYSLKEQQRIIEDRLKGMLHLSEQRDDISILGIRLS